jgi:transcriptional regulator with XRE-family HTH domain
LTSAVHQAREALGQRLRELRREAGLTGRDLATRADWSSSKVSKVEHGKQLPTEEDIRAWCAECGATDQISDLVASARNIEAMYLEWRRSLASGTRRRQDLSKGLEGRSRLLRWHEPLLVPGLLHTAEYATAVLARVIDFYRVPDDLAAGVAARMERQQVLYRGDHRFHFILNEQALRTIVGDTTVLARQLDRLLTVLAMPRLSLGIIPTRSPYRVPTNQFIIYDDRLVQVETVSAELTVNQPREIALYAKAFQELAQIAVHGAEARALIRQASSELGRG